MSVRSVRVLPAGVVALWVWTLAVTLARASRWPNDFAEAHWLLDYRFGFVKRALAGQVLSAVTGVFGLEPSETIIAAVSVGLLVAFCLTLLLLSLEIVRAARWSPTAVLVVTAMLSSPFVVTTAHLIGYFDNVVIMLTVMAVGLLMAGYRWTAAVAMSAAVLVHETAVVTGLPALALAWWVAGPAGARHRWRAALPLVLPVATFGLLAATAPLLSDGFEDAYSTYLSGFAFVGGDMHIFVPEWLTPGFLDQLATHRFAERIAFAEMYGLVLPTAAALLAYAIEARRVRIRSVTAALLVIAFLAPQVLHLAAWDTTRIWTYSIATAFLACWVLARRIDRPGPVGRTVSWLALLAIVVNVMVKTPLLDNLAERFSLSARLGWYLPVLVAAGWLLWRSDDVPPGETP